LVATLGQYEHRNGLISASTGNHVQSIAYAGQLFGTRVIIYAPAEAANPLKLQTIRDLRGEVRLHAQNFDEAREEVERVALTEGLRYVHSANEPSLIAGVGTIGLEVLSCPCGVGLVAKHLRPLTRMIGVQSRSAPAVWRAWRQGHLTPFPTVTTRHEGLATNNRVETGQAGVQELQNGIGFPVCEGLRERVIGESIEVRRAWRALPATPREPRATPLQSPHSDLFLFWRMER
jgi:threonine dehydratase